MIAQLKTKNVSRPVLDPLSALAIAKAHKAVVQKTAITADGVSIRVAAEIVVGIVLDIVLSCQQSLESIVLLLFHRMICSVNPVISLIYDVP